MCGFFSSFVFLMPCRFLDRFSRQTIISCYMCRFSVFLMLCAWIFEVFRRQATISCYMCGSFFDWFRRNITISCFMCVCVFFFLCF